MKHKSCPTHCCVVHGCKYGHKDCPVVLGEVSGIEGRACEDCTETYASYDNFRVMFKDGTSFQHDSFFTILDAIQDFKLTANPIVEIEAVVTNVIYKKL